MKITSLPRHIILSSVARLVIPHFSMLSHKQQDFRKLMKTKYVSILFHILTRLGRNQWRGPAAGRLLGLWDRIPPGAWKCCKCCVLLGRGLCDELITRREESYRVWCVQRVWSRKPVREGHDKESGRSATTKIRRDITINVHNSSPKLPVILVRF
jgi:hypothetical protein